VAWVHDSIFKDCDIRGVFGTELSPDAAYRVARALGVKLAGKRVVVGGDVRVHTRLLQNRVTQALQSSGCHVLDLGCVPTPAFRFAIAELHADGGVMVTGSHNKPEYNGLKLVLGPVPLVREDFEEIRQMVERQEETSGEGSIGTVSLVHNYQAQMIRRFSPGGALKVVIDCGNGCYSKIAPEVFDKLGYRLVELFCEPDGTFPNRDPNPAIPAHLSALTAAVLESGADLGIAFDGDGDRVAFTDENGTVIPAEHVLVLLARRLLKRDSLASVVCDVKASMVVEEEVLRLGCIFIEEKSGHSYIRRRMILDQADLGGEVSGHFFFRSLNGSDDGLYSSLLVAQIVEQSGHSLATLTRGLARHQITPDLRLPYDLKEAQHLVMRLRDFFARERLSILDGVKVCFDDGWGLLRPSVTEPAVTLRFEATSPSHATDIALRFLEPVKEILPLLRQNYPEWFPTAKKEGAASHPPSESEKPPGSPRGKKAAQD
jgi:phosphomannomutase/phosphoglucomutase